MKIRIPVLAAILLAATFAQSGFAAESAHDNHPSADETGPTIKLHGVVNSVNAAAGRVNITHDPVPELKRPAMKINFKAHDPAMLKGLKPGMTVDFEIQMMGNEYHITHIAPAQ